MKKPEARSQKPEVGTVLIGLLVAAWVFLIVTRIVGPSDLHDKEQPRTIAYTADMLVNHFWLVPHDTFGIPATKPPLYNWLSVPFVAVFGFREWALKIPSIFASAAVVVMLLIYGRRTQVRACAFDDQSRDRQGATEQQCGNGACRTLTVAALIVKCNGLILGVTAAFIWLATVMTAKLMYLARPDMLVTAALIGAWCAATVMAQSSRSRPGVATVYWVCVIASAFAKGPLAILPLLYLPLAMKVFGGSFGKLKESGWWWGLPLLLITSGIYVYCCHRQEPEFFRQIVLHKELGQRVTTPMQWIRQIFHGPFYLFTRFLPWSIPGVLMVLLIPPRRWRSHPLSPAILWVLLFVASMTFVSTHRPDRYAPVFPAMAIIAAYGLLYGLRSVSATSGRQAPPPPCRLNSYVVALAMLIIVGLAVNNQFYSESARTRNGRHVFEFADAVRRVVGDDVVLFGDGEATPLETLLGRNQQVSVPEETLLRAKWCIRYYLPGTDAVAISQPLPLIDDALEGGRGRLGLYRLEPGEGVAAFRDIRNSFRPSNSGTPDRWMQLQHVHPPLEMSCTRRRSDS